MRLFLDTSVLLAAAGSGGGALRFVLDEAASNGWKRVTADYRADEVRRNLPKLRRAYRAFIRHGLPNAFSDLCDLCAFCGDAISFGFTAPRFPLSRFPNFPISAFRLSPCLPCLCGSRAVSDQRSASASPQAKDSRTL